MSALFRQQVRYGEGRARLIRKHPDAFTKETLIPVGICLATILSILAMFFGNRYPLFASVVLVPMGLYLAVVLATGIRESMRRKRFFPGFLIFSAIWITHFGLGWGFINGLFSSAVRERTTELRLDA